jgi:hypothetical protein
MKKKKKIHKSNFFCNFQKLRNTREGKRLIFVFVCECPQEVHENMMNNSFGIHTCLLIACISLKPHSKHVQRSASISEDIANIKFYPPHIDRQSSARGSDGRSGSIHTARIPPCYLFFFFPCASPPTAALVSAFVFGDACASSDCEEQKSRRNGRREAAS